MKDSYKEEVIFKRDFKGIWMPKEVYLWDISAISWDEKILLVEIDSLDNGVGCFAKNEYFAVFLQKSPGTIQNKISKLQKLNLLEQIGFDGRRRYLRSVLHPDFGKKVSPALTDSLEQQPLENDAALTEPLEQKSSESQSYIIIQNDEKITKQFTKEEAFLFVWELYQYKKSKAKSKKRFLKLSCTKIQKIIDHVPSYVKSTPEKRFRAHLSTYLNEERWNDEITLPDDIDSASYRVAKRISEQYETTAEKR